jgi:O-antigen/teichoic acid export membrane protein
VIQAIVAGTGVAVARMLGVEDRGNLAFLVLITSILAQAGFLGLPTAATYFLANREYDARGILTAVRRPAVVLAAVWVPIQLLLLLKFFQGDAPIAATLSLTATPGMFAFLLGLAFLQGQQEFTRFNLMRVLPALTYAGSLLVVFILGSSDLGTIGSLWAIGVALTGAVTLFLGVRAILLRGRSGGSQASSRGLLSFGLKGLLGSTYPVDTFQLDQAVVGLFMSPALLGVYVVAVAFTNLPRFLGQSVGIVAYPTIANSADPVESRRHFRKFTLFTVAASLLIVAVIETTAGWLVPFCFGNEFNGAVPLVRILVVAAALTAVRRVLTEGLRGQGNPGIGSIAELVAWAVLVPAAVVFGSMWEAKGVAFAMVLSAFAGLVAITLGSPAPKDGVKRMVASGTPAALSEERL